MCPPSCWPSLAPTSRNHMLLAATCRRISWRLNMHIYGLMFQCAGRMIFWVTRNYNCFCPSAVKVEYSQSTSVSQIGCCLQARFIQCTFLLDCIFKLSDPWYSYLTFLRQFVSSKTLTILSVVVKWSIGSHPYVAREQMHVLMMFLFVQTQSMLPVYSLCYIYLLPVTVSSFQNIKNS